jgi:RHS repeat-associated protein
VNRLQTITDPKQSTITYQYDLTGNKKSETNAKNHTMTYEYDKLNRLVTVIDPYNKVVTRNIYDANNNITKVIDGKGYLSAGTDDARYGTLYFYDLANRLVKITDPEIAETNDPNLSTSKYQYNTVGQIIRETDGLGNAKVYEYDQAGRVIKVIDPLEISTTYSYDKAGNKLYMVDGRGKITKYQYGAFGKLRVVANADDKSVQYQYDIAMNLASMLDRNGKQTLYSYDNRNLLLDKKVAGTMDKITYTYDALGNRASMVDESGESSYSYDENSRLKEIKKGGISQVAYTYDAIGNVASVTDKKGFTTSYTYDKASRMETVGYKGKTTSYIYDENGNRQAINYHGGVKEKYVYDKNNRLLTLTNQAPSGSVLSSFTYTYDLAGRQDSKTDSFGTTSYVYDKAGRIIKVEAPGKTTIYGYDQAGNRQSMHETYTSAQPSGYTDPATQQTVQYSIKKSEYIYTNTNTLLKLVEKLQDETGKELLEKTTAYLYDDNGNELRQTTSYMMAHNKTMRPSNGANPYGDTIEGDISSLIEKVSNSFDGFNRLKKTEKVKGGERVSVEYTYNGDGLRTQKTTKSSKDGYKAKVINYLYDRQHVILETDQNDSIITTYVRGINYIGRYDGSNHLSYYLYNGHGDVVQTATESGQVENQYDYDIFGNPTLTLEVYENAIRYAGEFYDAETGLYYLRARYYDPYVGRFISEDSYWGEDTNPLSLNLYTYCANNPILYVDPTGHAFTEWDDQNVTDEEDREDIFEATKEWDEAHRAGDKEAEQAAHAKAEAARQKYRDKDEYGSEDGFTYSKDSDDSDNTRKSKKDKNKDNEYTHDNVIVYDGKGFYNKTEAARPNSKSPAYIDEERIINKEKSKYDTLIERLESSHNNINYQKLLKIIEEHGITDFTYEVFQSIVDSETDGMIESTNYILGNNFKYLAEYNGVSSYANFNVLMVEGEITLIRVGRDKTQVGFYDITKTDFFSQKFNGRNASSIFDDYLPTTGLDTDLNNNTKLSNKNYKFYENKATNTSEIFWKNLKSDSEVMKKLASGLDTIRGEEDGTGIAEDFGEVYEKTKYYSAKDNSFVLGEIYGHAEGIKDYNWFGIAGKNKYRYWVADVENPNTIPTDWFTRRKQNQQNDRWKKYGEGR